MNVDSQTNSRITTNTKNILNKNPIPPCSVLNKDLLKIIFGSLDIVSLCNRASLISREWYLISSKMAYKYYNTCFNSIIELTNKTILKKERAELFCKFAKILFEKNVRDFKFITFHYKDGSKDYGFKLTLNKIRQLNWHFPNNFSLNISTIKIPKIITFVNNYGFEIKNYENQFLINTSLLREVYNICSSVYIDSYECLNIRYSLDESTDEKENLFFSAERTKKLLDSVRNQRYIINLVNKNVVIPHGGGFSKKIMALFIIRGRIWVRREALRCRSRRRENMVAISKVPDTVRFTFH